MPSSYPPPRTARRLRVSFIGAGRMGERHARAFAQLSDLFELAAVHDAEPERARALAATLPLTVAPAAEAAIERADVVVVATPPSAHERPVSAALRAGRAVLVEKPIALSVEAASRLVTLAFDAGAPLYVGHSERFNPVIAHLSKVAAPDHLRGLSFRRIGDPSLAPACESVLLDLGIHDLDLAGFLLATPLEVTEARSGVAVEVRLRTSGGIPVTLHAQRAGLPPAREASLRVAGGVYHADLLRHRLTFSPAGGESTPLRVEPADPLREQARALYRALATSAKASLATAVDGARAVELARLAEKLSGPSSVWYPGQYHASLGR